MAIKTKYFNFLNQYFKGLEIIAPLFYNWNSGLRFDLQKEFTNPVDTDNTKYFNEVYYRARKLFEFCFNENDNIYLTLFSYKWKKRRIKKSNYIYKLIKSSCKTEKAFSIISNRYEPNEKWNRLIINEKLKNLDHENLIVGLCNTDFPSMFPCIREEVYIMNIDKKLIFHIYDVRGLDIIASDNKILSELYDHFSDWILEYDRDEIKQRLNK